MCKLLQRAGTAGRHSSVHSSVHSAAQRAQRQAPLTRAISHCTRAQPPSSRCFIWRFMSEKTAGVTSWRSCVLSPSASRRQTCLYSPSASSLKGLRLNPGISVLQWRGGKAAREGGAGGGGLRVEQAVERRSQAEFVQQNTTCAAS